LAPEGITIFPGLANALQDPDLSKIQLRNKIYADFKHNGIDVPPNCIDPGEGKEDEFYELDLGTLFNSVAGDLGDGVQLMERMELNVTTTSLSVLKFITEAFGELKLGEFKHKRIYSRLDASTQCFLYLHRLMYYLRVKQGIPVAAVHGFGFCGHKCRDQRSLKVEERKTNNNSTDRVITPGEYSVGFFKLSAPTKLGALYKAQQMWKKFGTDDVSGVKLCLHFLKSGAMSDMRERSIRNEACVTRSPSLFALPRSYWRDTATRRLVVNRTASIVFQLSLQEIGKLVGEFAENSQGLSLYIQNKLQPWINGEQEDSTGSLNYYFKVRTRDTVPEFNCDFRMLYDDITLLDPDVSVTYPIIPLGDVHKMAYIMKKHSR